MLLSKGTAARAVLVLSIVAVLVCTCAVSGASDASTAEDDITRSLLAAGDHALVAREYQEALSKFTEALVRHPRSERGLYSRAELLSMMRQRERSLADVDALLTINPSHPQALALRITLNVHAAHLESALTDARHLLAVYKQQRKAKKERETQEMVKKLERYVGRWKALSRVLDLTNTHSDTIASTAGAQKPYVECVSLLKSVIEDFVGDNLDLRLRRASCALAMEDSQTATAELKYVLQRDANNLDAIALNARALRILGALDQAKSELRRCLSLDPEYAPCATLHKRIRAQQKTTQGIEAQLGAKLYAQAIESIAAVRQAEPHSPMEGQLLEWECEALVGNRDATNGLRVCQAVLDRFGSEGSAAFNTYLHMAELNLLNDDYDAAERAVRKARDLQPRSGRAEELMQKIDKLRRSGARKDYYKILEVKKSASSQEIRRAYRKLAKKHHPDQLRSKEISEKEREKADKLFRDINEAKEVLTNEELRGRYDNGEDVMNPHSQQQQQGQPFYGHPFQFSFNGFPGGGFPGGGFQGQRQYFRFQ